MPAVQQQCGPWGGSAEHVDFVEKPELVAANDIGRSHEVGGADGIRPEAQMRLGLRTRFLRVVDEVALGVQPFFGPQDLDRVLVRADRSVRTQPEEDRPDCVG